MAHRIINIDISKLIGDSMDSSKESEEWEAVIHGSLRGDYGPVSEWVPDFAKRIHHAVQQAFKANEYSQNLLIGLAETLRQALDRHRNELIGTSEELYDVQVLLERASLTLAGFELKIQQPVPVPEGQVPANVSIKAYAAYADAMGGDFEDMLDAAIKVVWDEASKGRPALTVEKLRTIKGCHWQPAAPGEKEYSPPHGAALDWAMECIRCARIIAESMQ